jgi:MazG family protein
MNDAGQWSAAAEAFSRFCETVSALRHPQTGCPWDLQQDHRSLRRYMIEEAYEAAEVMSGEDHQKLRGELGDVLLQVVLNSQIAMQNGEFNVIDVINEIDAKMRRRHPHVFGDHAVRGTADVRANWEKIKAAEKAAEQPKHVGVFSNIGHRQSPLLRAFEIGKIAKKIDFDWGCPGDVLKQLQSEVQELSDAMSDGGEQSTESVQSELADTFFSLVQLCRHLELDPETVALDGCLKFEKRFAALEALARQQGVEVSRAGNQKLEELWVAAKAADKSKKP